MRTKGIQKILREIEGLPVYTPNFFNYKRVARLVENEAIDLIIHVLRYAKQIEDEDKQFKCLFRLSADLNHIGHFNYVLSAANQLMESDDPEDIFCALFLDQTIIDRHLAYPPTEDHRAEKLKVREMLSLSINEIAEKGFQIEDEDVIVQTISFVDTCVKQKHNINQSIVNQIYNMIESESERVSLKAIDTAANLSDLVGHDALLSIVDYLIESIQNEEDEEQISFLVQTLTQFIKHIKPEDAMESFQVSLLFFQEVIENPNVIYFSSVVSLVCVLFSLVGREASEYSTDLLEAATEMLSPNDTYLESGLEICKTVLKEINECNEDILMPFADCIVKALTAEDPIHNEFLMAGKAAIEVARHIENTEILEEIGNSLLFYKKLGKKELENDDFATAIALIGEKVPEFIQENAMFILECRQFNMTNSYIVSKLKLVLFLLKSIEPNDDNISDLTRWRNYIFVDVEHIDSEHAHLFLEIFGMEPKEHLTLPFDIEPFKEFLNQEECAKLDESYADQYDTTEHCFPWRFDY